jgi:mediator of RNA polymerase II transcription subunit 16
VSEIPFDWRVFDRLVTDTHAHVRAAYKHANATDAERNAYERALMLGHIPDILMPIAKRLVTDTLWTGDACLADRLDSGRLMFFDTTWLGFQESKRAAEWHDVHVVDVCQKMIIRGTGTQQHPSAVLSSQQRGRSDSIQSTSVDGKKKGQLRRCTRCSAYMEDVMQGLPGYSTHHASWLMGVAKHCVCGNSWMLALERERAK